VFHRQIPIYNSWVDGHGFSHLKDAIPVTPKLADVFNKQVEISKVIRKGLFAIHSLGQLVTDEWAEIFLNEIDATFTRFKGILLPEMRLKQWTYLSEPIQPHLAALQYVHSCTASQENLD
jgi:hypothetical protein